MKPRRARPEARVATLPLQSERRMTQAPRQPWAALLHLQKVSGNRATAMLLRDARGASLMEPVREWTDPISGTTYATARESPRLGKGENPTYDDAVDYVDDYFDRVVALGTLTVEMKDTAFQRFKAFSGKEYNQADDILLDVFLAALELIPAAGPALNVVASMTKKTYTLRKFVKTAEKIGKIYETGKGVYDKGKKFKEAATKSEEGHEGKARVAFEIDTIDTLADLRIGVLEQWWAAEDVVKARLTQLRSVAPSYDLLATVEGYLEDTFGPMPKPATLRKAMEEVANAFELLLYKQYYGKSAYWQEGAYHGWPTPEDLKKKNWYQGSTVDLSLQGIPKGVQERIKILTGKKSIFEALKDWNLRHEPHFIGWGV